jgi:cytochrome P450
VTHPDGVQQVLAGGAGGYVKGSRFYREIAATLGDGLLTSDRPRWRRQRRTVAPLFPHRRIAGYVPVMAPPWRRRASRARRALYAAVDAVIERRRRVPGGGDLVSLLPAARDPETGAPLSTQEVRDQVLIFLIAGHETTATALTFTCHLLGRHPQAQRRVHRELDEVLGGRPPPPTTWPGLPTPARWSRRRCGCTRRPTPSVGAPRPATASAATASRPGPSWC